MLIHCSESSISTKVRVNALIKRASLFIQRCQDPVKDPQLALEDFGTALNLDKDNADIYHHRGQVSPDFLRRLNFVLLESLQKQILCCWQ